MLFTFGAMGWLGVPLGVATSMFSAMTLGVGVDYAIHLLERWKSLRAVGASAEEAMRAALASSGPTICVDAASVALGFGILTLSQVPASARLGGMLALSLGAALLATFLVLPAAARVLPRR
jgi:predicted RND superfamily exporter protein